MEENVFLHGNMTSKNNLIQIWLHEVQFDLFIKQMSNFQDSVVLCNSVAKTMPTCETF